MTESLKSRLTRTAATIPDLAELPARVDRKRGAELVTKFYFPISHRTLERWPLPVRHLNGKAVMETRDLLAMAASLLDAAPVLATCRQPTDGAHIRRGRY